MRRAAFVPLALCGVLLCAWPRAASAQAPSPDAAPAVLPPAVAPAAAMSSPAAEQSDASIEAWLGKTIASVRLVRLGQDVTDERLLALIETKAGQPLSMREVRSSLLHLFNTGLFEDAVVDAQAAPGSRASSGEASASAPASAPGAAPGVALVYRLTPARAIARYQFEGPAGLSDDVLRRALVERYGARPAIGRVQAATATLEAVYRDAGYLNAKVASRFDQVSAETVAMVFTVDSGSRAQVGRIDVTGTPAITREELLDRLDLTAGQPFDGPSLQRRIEKAERDLRNRGFYEATITSLKIERDAGRFIDLTIDLQPGPRVTLRVEGASIPASKQEDLIPVRREGSIDEDLLEDSKRRIEEYLRSLGHWKAEVSYDRRTTPTGLDLVFTVKEGAVYRVGALKIDGNQAIALPEIESLFATASGSLYVESDVDGKTSALVERYRRLGYRLIKIDQTVQERDNPQGSFVDITLAVTEGPRTMVGDVTFKGLTQVDEATLRQALTVKSGAPFYEPQLATSREAIQTQYLNRGFDRVAVDATPAVSTDQTRADIAFTVQEGAQLFIDRIVIVGNRRTDIRTIEKALTIERGKPLGLSELFESQRRLSALGLFRRVRITDVGEPGETRRDVIVTVDEAPATTIGYGAGIEAGRRLRAATSAAGGSEERIEFAGRGFFEVGRRNLFGSNRSATLFMRGSLRPRETPDPADGGFGFNEYRVLVNLRDPSVFGTAMSGQVAGYFEQAIRSSFNFRRRGVQAQIARPVAPHFTVVGSYSFSKVELFDEQIAPEDQLDIDRLFPQVRLSVFSLAARRDTRDDPLDPTRGSAVALDGDMALRAVGSEVGFLKTFGEAFWYRQLPSLRKAVFATGARVGLARGLERQVPRLNESNIPVVGPDGQPLIDTITDLPASERFFAGGDTTVRGYARDTLGDTATIRDGFPTGGNALVIFNAELRMPVWREFGAVVFSDVGNVFRRVTEIDLGALRPTAGFGIRYKSPIGPIRVDLGFKLDRSRFPERNERLTEFHISIGQAF
jgi:outer membrane protein insertion porin family